MDGFVQFPVTNSNNARTLEIFEAIAKFQKGKLYA